MEQRELKTDTKKYVSACSMQQESLLSHFNPNVKKNVRMTNHPGGAVLRIWRGVIIDMLCFF
jgi:hypothetical protein